MRRRSFEDKLHEEALYSFVKSLQSDRMVAITGSMATRGRGYPSMAEFVRASAKIAMRVAEDIQRDRRNEPAFIHGQSPPNLLLEDIKKRAKQIVDHAEEGAEDAQVLLWDLYHRLQSYDAQMRDQRSGLVIDNVYQKGALARYEKAVSLIFQRPTGLDLGNEDEGKRWMDRPSPVHELIASLGIKRIATLNYDFELERAFMLRGDEREILKRADPAWFDTKAADNVERLYAAAFRPTNESNIESFLAFIGDEASGRPVHRLPRTHTLRRRMTNGVLVESDIVDRERPDKLFEFAVGSSEIDRHILHLHGRADDPASMIANVRDYDRLYRLDDLYRDPFDHGLRVLFGGNPTVFVGVGMSEEEVNRTLRYFKSNAPLRRPAPSFVIWDSSTDTGTQRQIETRRQARRLNFWVRLGVRIIYDHDLGLVAESLHTFGRQASPSPPQAYSTHSDPAIVETAANGGPDGENGEEPKMPVAALTKPTGPVEKETAKEQDQNRKRASLVRSLQALPALVERVDMQKNRGFALPPSKPTATSDLNAKTRRPWRTLERRLEWSDACNQRPGDELGSCTRMWGSVSLRSWAEKRLGSVPNSPILEVSSLSADDRPRVIFVNSVSGSGRGTLAELMGMLHPDKLTGVNSPIEWVEPKDRLIIHAGFSYDSDAMLNGMARFLNRLGTSPALEPFNREQLIRSGRLFNTKRPALVVINGGDRFFGLDGIPLSSELDLLIRSAIESKGSVQFVLLATNRLLHYCASLDWPFIPLSADWTDYLRDDKRGEQGDTQDRPDKDDSSVTPEFVRPMKAEIAPLRSVYLLHVLRCFKKHATEVVVLEKEGQSDDLEKRFDITPAAQAYIRRAMSVDRTVLARAFFDAYLSPSLLQHLGVHCPETFEILRTMCFVGAPIEAAVLLHAPKIWVILAEDSQTKGDPEPEYIGGDPSAYRFGPGTDLRSDEEVIDRLIETVVTLYGLGLLSQIDRHIPPAREGNDSAEPSLETGDQLDALLQKVRTHQRRVITHRHSRGERKPPKPGSHLRFRPDERRLVLSTRFGLHRALATFLRDRHGAPLNDAKLATTFNMSMFMSEPSDNFTPEPAFHDELGDLVDSLIGSWKDLERIDEAVGKVPGLSVPLQPFITKIDPDKNDAIRSLAEQLYVHPDDKEKAVDSIEPRSRWQSSACLRAALLLVRGYFSTGALLKLDAREGRFSPERKGALTEHAERLDRLRKGFGSNVTAREIISTQIDAFPEGEERDTKIRNGREHLGAEAFYADDIVWLLNERGVVALAQGHVFDAREAFSKAKAVNEAEVEPGEPGHNARRIDINRVAMMIERGNPKAAARLIDRIERSINTAPYINALGERQDRIEAIRALFAGSPLAPPVRGTRDFTREEMLIVGMLTGYRGLVAHLHGHMHQAQQLYDTASSILRALGEQRSHAHFERHSAVLHRAMGLLPEAKMHIGNAIAAAEASKQMDILYRSRAVRAAFPDTAAGGAGLSTNSRLQDIKSALYYAAQSDCFRLRIEASSALAKQMRYSGDYDTALRYACDALTFACRFGHSLQKTELRIEIGKILILRGDPLSGNALLDRATEIAVGKGYHLALESIRKAKSHLGPRLSPSGGNISIF